MFLHIDPAPLPSIIQKRILRGAAAASGKYQALDKHRVRRRIFPA